MYLFVAIILFVVVQGSFGRITEVQTSAVFFFNHATCKRFTFIQGNNGSFSYADSEMNGLIRKQKHAPFY